MDQSLLITHFYHSGFSVSDGQTLLVFDYWRGERGELSPDKQLTPEKLKKARPDLCVMHPLPRVNEISVAVDDDPRACYFKQVLNGKYMRMALILMLLNITKGGVPA